MWSFGVYIPPKRSPSPCAVSVPSAFPVPFPSAPKRMSPSKHLLSTSFRPPSGRLQAAPRGGSPEEEAAVAAYTAEVQV